MNKKIILSLFILDLFILRNLILKKQKQLSELLDGNEVQGIDFEICCVTVKEESNFVDESKVGATFNLSPSQQLTSVALSVKDISKPSHENSSIKVDPIRLPETKTTPKTVISLAHLEKLPIMPRTQVKRVFRIPAKKIVPAIPAPAPREMLKFDKSKPLLVITPQYLKTLDQQRTNSMQIRSYKVPENKPEEEIVEDADEELFNEKVISDYAYTKQWVNCQLCGAGVKDEIDRELHIKLAHPEKIKFRTFNGPFQCQKCPRVFKLEQACRIHWRGGF